MTGGPSTPALVAAVSGAGGLGLYGVQGLRAAAVAEAVAATRALTPAPFGVNVQLAAPFERGDAAVVQAALAPLRRALGLPPRTRRRRRAAMRRSRCSRRPPRPARRS